MFCTWVYRDYDLTLSSMCGLELKKKNPRRWARVLGWCLDWLQPDHVNLAIRNDIQRAEEALAILRQVPVST